MLIVFAVAFGWVVLVATWIVRRLTGEHHVITAVARRVAVGDLSARIGARGGVREIVKLAHDIDERIDRMSLLVTSQQRFIAHAAHELRSPLTTRFVALLPRATDSRVT